MASLATLHFVDNNSISSDQTFIRRLCTRRKAPLLQEHSLILRKIKFLFTSLGELHQLKYCWTIFLNFLMNEWPTWPTFRGKVLRKCRMFFLVVISSLKAWYVCFFRKYTKRKQQTNKQTRLVFFSFSFSFFLQVQRDNRCSQWDHKCRKIFKVFKTFSQR